MSTVRPSVESVARAALAALSSDANLILACQWVSERYAQLAGRTTLRALRRVGAVTIPAVVTAGSVTITQNSPIIVGDATAAAAWSLGLVGRFFQVAQSWYRVTDVRAGTLYVDTPLVEASATGGSYRIVPRYLSLAEDVRRLGSFVIEETRQHLRLVSANSLDHHAPTRTYMTGGPSWVTEFGSDLEGRKTIECYPYTSTALHCTYRYVARPPVLEQRDTLPGSVDSYVLKEGVLIDVMRYQAAQKAQQGSIEAAGYWRNESRVQEGKYEALMLRAIQSDRGTEETEEWLRASGSRHAGAIRTAHEQLARVWP